jgi:hypothetical protein
MYHEPDHDPDGGGWLVHLERREQLALVIADEPLRQVLVEVVRSYGFDAIAPATPLEVVQRLLAEGPRIACAVISPDVSWAAALHDYLADEYPAIEPTLLAA